MPTMSENEVKIIGKLTDAIRFLAQFKSLYKETPETVASFDRAAAALADAITAIAKTPANLTRDTRSQSAADTSRR